MKRDLPHVLEQALLIEMLDHFRQQPRFVLPQDAAVVAAHQEQMSVGIPLTKMPQRIRFSINDVHHTARQLPIFGRLQDGQQLVQMVIVCGRRSVTGAINGIGSLLDSCAVNELIGTHWPGRPAFRWSAGGHCQRSDE